MEMPKPVQYPEPDIVNDVISSSDNSDHNSTSSYSDFVNQPRVKRRRDCLRKTTNKRNAAKRESINSTISIRNSYKKTKRENSRFSESVLNGNDLPLKNKFAVLSKLEKHNISSDIDYEDTKCGLEPVNVDTVEVRESKDVYSQPDDHSQELSHDKS